MKLNPNCVRDILLLIEEGQQMETRNSIGETGKEISRYTGEVNFVNSNQIVKSDRLKNYPACEIYYSIKQLHDANLIAAKHSCNIGGSDYIIRDITPQGHEFLNNVRSNDIWQKIKSISGKVGVKSLGGMLQIGTNVISEIIKRNI